MLSQPSPTKLINSLSSKKANNAEVNAFTLQVVCSRWKGEKSPGESRCAILFVTKGKKKNLAETELLPPDEQSLHMKILRVNFFSYGWASGLKQHFEILNPVEYGWKISEEKLEPNWFEGSALPSIKDID